LYILIYFNIFQYIYFLLLQKLKLSISVLIKIFIFIKTEIFVKVVDILNNGKQALPRGSDNAHPGIYNNVKMDFCFFNYDYKYAYNVAIAQYLKGQLSQEQFDKFVKLASLSNTVCNHPMVLTNVSGLDIGNVYFLKSLTTHYKDTVIIPSNELTKVSLNLLHSKLKLYSPNVIYLCNDQDLKYIRYIDIEDCIAVYKGVDNVYEIFDNNLVHLNKGLNGHSVFRSNGIFREFWNPQTAHINMEYLKQIANCQIKVADLINPINYEE
jgi:hypothetical protein